MNTLMTLEGAQETVRRLNEAKKAMNDDWSYRVEEAGQAKAYVMVIDENGEELGRL